MTCPRCNIPYSDDVPLNPVIGGLMNDPVCAICALQMINAVHGIRRTHFQGETAEYYRELAAEWRRTHPREVQAAREDRVAAGSEER